MAESGQGCLEHVLNRGTGFLALESQLITCKDGSNKEIFASKARSYMAMKFSSRPVRQGGADIEMVKFQGLSR